MPSNPHLRRYKDSSFSSAARSNLAYANDRPQPELGGFFHADSRPDSARVKLCLETLPLSVALSTDQNVLQ